jgi:hypothetical protein
MIFSPFSIRALEAAIFHRRCVVGLFVNFLLLLICPIPYSAGELLPPLRDGRAWQAIRAAAPRRDVQGVVVGRGRHEYFCYDVSRR